jgi:hypothetical protein
VVAYKQAGDTSNDNRIVNVHMYQPGIGANYSEETGLRPAGVTGKYRLSSVGKFAIETTEFESYHMTGGLPE